MAKWINSGSIVCKEVHTSHSENHNTVSGNPTFNVRLKVPYSQLDDAISALLGTPEVWPHPTIFGDEVHAVSISMVNDGSKYVSDSDDQILSYEGSALLDVTYMRRNGKYVTRVEDDIDMYFEDSVEARNESIPLNNNHFIWGTQTPDGIPNDPTITLAPEEAPPRYEPGDTLTHIVEGWSEDASDLGTFIGTVNFEPYTSPNLQRTFAAETLLLRNIQMSLGFTFLSYRQPQSPAPTPPMLDFSGQPSLILKFIYEYKPNGWKTFYRYDLNSQTYESGYYYIRYATSPYERYEPFPVALHDAWLSYN